MAGAIRVLFVIPSLEGGGAERACVNLLRHLDRSRFEPSLALFRREGPYLDDVPSDVTVYDLGGGNTRDLRVLFRLARLVRDARPAVLFSIMRYSNLIALLAASLARCEVKVAINEQNRLREEFATYGWGWAKGIAVRWLYPRADAITAISQGIREELIRGFGLPEDKVSVIYNPVYLDGIQALGRDSPNHPWFNGNLPVVLAAGRLHPQKGFAYLIRAFQRVSSCLPARLLILGEGPERGKLEALIAELRLEESVALLGFQRNPYSFMAKAAVFVLSSLYEGFGNVLVEAMALGVPVVATRCPSGPEEIIEDGLDGLLVPVADEERLAEAILRVLTEKELAAKFRQRGPERVRAFDASHIASQYASLFESLCES
ncbi:MAG: glycosyltransferase [Anaerolineae bacterium]